MYSTFFQNHLVSCESFPEKIVEAIKISVESECLKVLLVLLKYLIHTTSLKEQSKDYRQMIKEILHSNYEYKVSVSQIHHKNLLMAVKKSQKLMPAQSAVLCIEEIIFDKGDKILVCQNYS